MTFKEYVRPATLEEAWQLNQKKSNRIIGGMLWMKMSKMRFNTAIDLSALPLHSIEETDVSFVIGCMTTLRDIECHERLNAFFRNAPRSALNPIVGVQFRNAATIGGSLFGRYGFSDVLTLFMALDAEVVLYRGGQMKLSEFSTMKYDRDILTHVVVPKKQTKVVYLSQRNTATDFPVLACAVSKTDGLYRAAIGARPMRAVPVQAKESMTPSAFADYVQTSVCFGSNMRASADYRRHICGVLVRRACEQLEGDDK